MIFHFAGVNLIDAQQTPMLGCQLASQFFWRPSVIWNPDLAGELGLLGIANYFWLGHPPDSQRVAQKLDSQLPYVARKYQPSKVQLFCAKKLPIFKKQRNPQKWVANHYPCRPRCYPRLAHVHVNHLSVRAASRNHLGRQHGQCQGLSWDVVSWFCGVYWLIGILIMHYGWCIKIISMKSGRATRIKRTGWIGHQSPYSRAIKCVSQERFEMPHRRLPRQTRLLHLGKTLSSRLRWQPSPKTSKSRRKKSVFWLSTAPA